MGDETRLKPAAGDVAAIHDWHAHVYFDPNDRAPALRLREWVGARFPAAVLGRWHAVPVGPHPTAMYQIAFGPELFPTLVPFLALNRMGLTVLVHPESGRPRDDHLRHALWMGEVLPLKADILPEVETPR
jgi:aromatic ring-cleaving dioxygenase